MLGKGFRGEKDGHSELLVFLVPYREICELNISGII